MAEPLRDDVYREDVPVSNDTRFSAVPANDDVRTADDRARIYAAEQSKAFEEERKRRDKVESVQRKVRAGAATAQVGGKTVAATGRGVSAIGRGTTRVGMGVTRAGAALTGTGIGAVVGVPLMIGGAATTAVGAGATVTGRGMTAAGRAADRAGRQTARMERRFRRMRRRKYKQTKKSDSEATELKMYGMGFNMMLFAAFVKDISDIFLNISIILTLAVVLTGFLINVATILYFMHVGVRWTTRVIVTVIAMVILEMLPVGSFFPGASINMLLVRFFENGGKVKISLVDQIQRAPV